MLAKDTGDRPHIGRRPPAMRPLTDLWFAALGAARIYRRLVLLTRPLGLSAPELSAPAGIRIAVLAPEEIGAYLAFRPEQTNAEIRIRLSRGHLCFAAWHDRQIVHAAWGTTQRAPIEYLSHEIELSPDEVFVFDSFTAPPLGDATCRRSEPSSWDAITTNKGPARAHGRAPREPRGLPPTRKGRNPTRGLARIRRHRSLRWHFCRGRE